MQHVTSAHPPGHSLQSRPAGLGSQEQPWSMARSTKGLLLETGPAPFDTALPECRSGWPADLQGT